MMNNKFLLIAFAFFVLISCSPNRAHNFQVRNVTMQRAIIDGLENDSLEFYKVTLTVEDCNEFYSLMGVLSYQGGLNDSIQSIRVYNEKEEEVTCLLKGLTTYAGLPFSVLEIVDRCKQSFFSYSCTNFDAFKEEMNSMSINLRGEEYNNKDSTHRVNRIFCFPKENNPLKKMTVELKKRSVSCIVDDRPIKLKVAEVFR